MVPYPCRLLVTILGPALPPGPSDLRLMSGNTAKMSRHFPGEVTKALLPSGLPAGPHAFLGGKPTTGLRCSADSPERQGNVAPGARPTRQTRFSFSS